MPSGQCMYYFIENTVSPQDHQNQVNWNMHPSYCPEGIYYCSTKHPMCTSYSPEGIWYYGNIIHMQSALPWEEEDMHHRFHRFSQIGKSNIYHNLPIYIGAGSPGYMNWCDGQISLYVMPIARRAYGIVVKRSAVLELCVMVLQYHNPSGVLGDHDNYPGSTIPYALRATRDQGRVDHYQIVTSSNFQIIPFITLFIIFLQPFIHYCVNAG
jgi:hypothetical protein